MHPLAAPCAGNVPQAEQPDLRKRNKNIIPTDHPTRRTTRRSEFPITLIPVDSTLDDGAVTSAATTARRIRRRDGFTSWLIAPLRDAEIEFIIRRAGIGDGGGGNGGVFAAA